MQLPRLILKVIDPVTVHLQDQLPRRSGPIFHGGAIFGPGVEGGARQATTAELEHLRAEAETLRRDSLTRRRTDLDPALTAAVAHQLVELGRTAIHWGERDLSAHIITLWRGDSLVDITVHAPTGARPPRP